ncbi:MAG TPA: tRNA(Ile)-lysidine synthetase, partial [Clostridiales bacterium]|nr:tRNA(Ile)-lysidine synthetase [Clostridiales bacterium]
PKFKYNIVLHEPLEISEVGKVIHCKVLDVSEFNPGNKDTISIDYDLIEGRLIVRNRLTGDSMIPCGMTGIKKIKDIFIDMKVPKEERDKKLIIADDNNILWLEDFRIHNSFKVTSSTRKILNITIREQLNG